MSRQSPRIGQVASLLAASLLVLALAGCDGRLIVTGG